MGHCRALNQSRAPFFQNEPMYTFFKTYRGLSFFSPRKRSKKSISWCLQFPNYHEEKKSTNEEISILFCTKFCHFFFTDSLYFLFNVEKWNFTNKISNGIKSSGEFMEYCNASYERYLIVITFSLKSKLETENQRTPTHDRLSHTLVLRMALLSLVWFLA